MTLRGLPPLMPGQVETLISVALDGKVIPDDFHGGGIFQFFLKVPDVIRIETVRSQLNQQALHLGALELKH
ncbi:MAG: hypothetical protein AAB619_01535 [Patescibacteria group bacterium]